MSDSSENKNAGSLFPPENSNQEKKPVPLTGFLKPKTEAAPETTPAASTAAASVQSPDQPRRISLAQFVRKEHLNPASAPAATPVPSAEVPKPVSLGTFLKKPEAAADTSSPEKEILKLSDIPVEEKQETKTVSTPEVPAQEAIKINQTPMPETIAPAPAAATPTPETAPSPVKLSPAATSTHSATAPKVSAAPASPSVQAQPDKKILSTEELEKIFDDEVKAHAAKTQEQAKSQTPAPEPAKPYNPESAAKTPVKIMPKNTGTDKAAAATPTPAQPVKKHSKVLSCISAENASSGQILQECRVSRGLSLNQVEQTTRIKAQYIEAIERDDIENLPPAVYISAYIKSLCSAYDIAPEDVATILSKVKKPERKPAVSDKMLQHLEEEKQVNFEEKRKIKRQLVYVLIIILAFLIPSSSIFGYMYMKSHAKKATPAASGTGEERPLETAAASVKSNIPIINFSSSSLEKFLPPQQITMTALSVPSNGK